MPPEDVQASEVQGDTCYKEGFRNNASHPLGGQLIPINSIGSPHCSVHHIPLLAVQTFRRIALGLGQVERGGPQEKSLALLQQMAAASDAAVRTPIPL